MYEVLERLVVIQDPMLTLKSLTNMNILVMLVTLETSQFSIGRVQPVLYWKRLSMIVTCERSQFSIIPYSNSMSTLVVPVVVQ
jgi:hypothetical protein